MPLQNPSTGESFQWPWRTGTVEASAGKTGRKGGTRAPERGSENPSLHPTPHPEMEVNEMIDIQDIEVMAEALTCGSYNKG
ncbi:hypothetical protein ACGFY6_07545 [Streptomyces sp. NPDC048387]|uniref:hypothetical protein n=1 Tax=Streptomyces sp. NPDC048387 TaxID=3365542 RepID=UPI003720B36C